MKSIITISLLCLLFFAFQSNSAEVKEGAFFSKYLPSSQSCGIASQNLQYGWFWDGQKCERCRNDYCKCSTVYGCDGCASGYERISTKSQTSDFREPGTCVKCPSFAEGDQYWNESDESSKRTVFQNYFSYWTSYIGQGNPQISTGYSRPALDINALESAGGTYSYTGHVKRCCNPFSSDSLYWETDSENFKDLYRLGLRAQSCIDDEPGNYIRYKLTGSVCWYIRGCSEYTAEIESDNYDTPLRCKTCYDGFYLDQNHECRICDNPPYPKNGDTLSHCKQCSGPHQCDVCEDGYFLGTNDYKWEIDTLDEEYALRVREEGSYCIQCPKHNCVCSLSRPSSDTTRSNTFTYKKPSEVGDFYYYPMGDAHCKACSKYQTGTSLKACVLCYMEIDESAQTQNFICKECMVVDKSNPAKYEFYAKTPENNECKQCPDNCTECEIKNGSASCKNGKCENGYRWISDDDNLGKCEACANHKHSDGTEIEVRCTTKVDTQTDEVEITQCGTASDITGNYLSGVSHGYQNRSPPNERDFYLMTGDGGKKTCVKNIYNCRVMKDQSTVGSCEHCYSGWDMVSSVNGDSSLSACANCQLHVSSNCVQCESRKTPTKTTDYDNNKLLKCKQCKDSQQKVDYANSVTNYFLYVDSDIDDSEECLQCPKGCLTCSQTDAYDKSKSDDQDVIRETLPCESCQYGYALDTSSKQCFKCTVYHCQLCDAGDPDVCTQCFPNYRLWKAELSSEERRLQICEACEIGCARCKDTRKICTECQSGYYLWSDTCHVMKNNCILHDGTNLASKACKICAYGYRLVDGRCMACMSLRGAQYHCHNQCTSTFTTNTDLTADRKEPNTRRRILSEIFED